MHIVQKIAKTVRHINLLCSEISTVIAPNFFSVARMIKIIHLFDVDHLICISCQITLCCNRILLLTMRKFISILLLVSYFDTAFAVGIDIHFCSGRIADVKLAGFGRAHRDCPEGSMPKGCCKNETHFCKTDDHKGQAAAVASAKYFIKIPVLLPDYISPLPIMNFEKDNSLTNNSRRSKFKPSLPLFILNEIYRI